MPAGQMNGTLFLWRWALMAMFLLSIMLNLLLWQQAKITEITTNVKVSSNVTAVLGSNRPQKEKVIHILPVSQSFLILPPKHICRPGTKLVFVVKSKVDHFLDRQKIRLTWGKVALENTGVRVVFLVAYPGPDAKNVTEQLQAEAQRYNDIVQGSFIEAYRNLTMKTLMGLRWFSLYCRDATYMMSTDDDFRIDLKLIFSTYLNVSYVRHPKRVLHCGKISKNATVRREGKWAVPVSAYAEHNYPDYCYGFCYIMTHDVATELYWTSLTIDTTFDIDDVFITGLLRTKSQAKITLSEMLPYTCNCEENSFGEMTCGHNKRGKSPFPPKIKKLQF